MASRSLIFFALLEIFLCLIVNCISRRTWDVEMLEILTYSSEPIKANLSGRVERVARGQSVVSGVLDLNYDIDSSIVQMQILSSQSGRKDDYNPTPYKIQPNKFVEAMENYYQDLLYSNVANCSNIPEIKGKYVSPFPHGHYFVNRCAITANGFPDILPLGYYKLVFNIEGEIIISVTLIMKLIPRM